MDQDLTPARVTPPGRILERELEARGWSQKDLAVIMSRPPQAINEIIKGTKQIMPETALELAQAFDTSPELWLNLEANYRLYLAQRQKQATDIARRSQLYSLLPLADVIKYGWLEPSSSLYELENQVCNFLGIASPNETPRLAINLRHSQQRGPELNAQIAWVKRVEQLASMREAASFDRARLRKAIPHLLALSARLEDVSHVPTLLWDIGIRFIIVPHLPKTFIDGAAFKIDNQPVVALSLRYDRIDAFWFTLLHELAHILQVHPASHLDSLDENHAEVGATEDEANQLAHDWLINEVALRAFIHRTKPYFSRASIVRFAVDQQRHPGIILGRLHYEHAVEYKHLRALLVKVSPHLQDWIDVPPPR